MAWLITFNLKVAVYSFGLVFSSFSANDLNALIVCIFYFSNVNSQRGAHLKINRQQAAGFKAGEKRLLIIKNLWYINK